MNIMITHTQELMNNGVDERTISLWWQQQSQQTQMKYSIIFPTLNNSIEHKQVYYWNGELHGSLTYFIVINFNFNHIKKLFIDDKEFVVLV